MKNAAMIAIGSIFLIIAMICPFPTILSVSEIVGRTATGLVNCFRLIAGIYNCMCNEERKPPDYTKLKA